MRIFLTTQKGLLCHDFCCPKRSKIYEKRVETCVLQVKFQQFFINVQKNPKKPNFVGFFSENKKAQGPRKKPKDFGQKKAHLAVSLCAFGLVAKKERKTEGKNWRPSLPVFLLS